MEVFYMYLVRQLRRKHVYIFGAGNRGSCVFERLNDLGIEVIGFIDNDNKKVGQAFHGVRINKLEDITNKDAIVVLSPFNKHGIVEQLLSDGFEDWIDADEILYHIPIVKDKEGFRNVLPFNHYESPYSDINNLHQNYEKLVDKNSTILDVDFNIDRQLELLGQMKEIQTVKWENDKCDDYRYYYNNEMFGRGSADVLCYMMQIIRPRRIIEVGSGFSTAVMLDTNKFFFDNEIEITCIEPRAERLKSILRKEDNLIIYEKDVQDIEPCVFDKLEAGDFLFVDSSHVVRAGGDVNCVFFEILPRLKSGVYIHFHDIFWPFVYPEKWIYEGRAYNELYILRAFLMNNSFYSVQFFGEMLNCIPGDLVSSDMSLGGSIWIRKNVTD